MPGNRLNHIWRRARSQYQLYLFILPVTVYFILFSYWPMYGVQIAFKDFNAALGIWDSTWVGLKYFKEFFFSYYFGTILRNTIVISLYELIAGFPLPILFALLLNEVRQARYKKFVQTVTYAPHFISTVVIVGLVMIFTNPEYGMLNLLFKAFGFSGVDFMASASWFKHVYVWSGIWQSTGWGAVIYFAVLANVDSSLHEAAMIDGASKLQRIWHINLPVLLPTATILFILSMGSIISLGFEKIFLLQNPLNLDSSEVISTYVYKVGLLNARYSYSTAIGLFNSAINLMMLIGVNYIARRVSSTSLW